MSGSGKPLYKHLSQSSLRVKQSLALAALLGSVALGLGSCAVPSQICGNPIYTIQLARQNMGINERVPLTLSGNNPCGHTLEYRFVANRGLVISPNPLRPAAEYIAPFSGGEDRITVSVYNRSENRNLPQQSVSLLVLGDGLAYVESPASGAMLRNDDNGLIKVQGIQGPGAASQARQVALGRQPAISPDGRLLAYTHFPGDGSSQIRVQDVAGNVTILTGSGGSFNRDPSWAPIGNDLNQELAFSSDRVSQSREEIRHARGEAFNIWRVSAQGQDMKQVASTPGDDKNPTWSPDGKVLVYSSNFSQGQVHNASNLWRLELDSGKLLQLTYESAPDKGAYEPRFSPDGQRLVYSRKYILRQNQRLLELQKIWLLDLNTLDLSGLLPLPSVSPAPPAPEAESDTEAEPTAEPTPTPASSIAPNLLESSGSRGDHFGKLVTQEFDDVTREYSPSFSVDGRWITYVRQQGDEIRTLSVPGNPGNIGSASFEPMNVLPPGSPRAIEVSWARQSRSFSR